MKNGTTPSQVRGSRRPPPRGRAAALNAGLPAAVKRRPATSWRRRTGWLWTSGHRSAPEACRGRLAAPRQRLCLRSLRRSWPPCGQDGGHDDAVQALVRLGRVTGERDLALERWAKQVLDRGDGDLARVVPDAHVAAVVVEPEARRLFGAVRDVAPLLHLVWRELGGVGQRHGLADVDHIRRAAGAVERVDLVLAAAV